MEKPKRINYAHKITELICHRYFAQIGFKSLPVKFWKDPAFSRDYRLQIIKANALLKIYSGPAIIAALESFKGKKIYSLSAPWLDEICEREQKRIDKENRRLEEAIKKQQENTKISEIPCLEGKTEGQNPQGATKPNTLMEQLD